MTFVKRQRFVFFRPLVYWSVRRTGWKWLRKNHKNRVSPPLHATWVAICLTESGKNVNEDGATDSTSGNKKRIDGRTASHVITDTPETIQPSILN